MIGTVPAKLPQFAELLDQARQLGGMTAAELDHGLAFPASGNAAGIDRADACYMGAIYALVEHPDVNAAPVSDLAGAADAIREHYRPDLDAHIAAAVRRGFCGWSDVARARGHRIRYADEA